MNRIDLDDKLCCGCAACANICVHKAISMIENEKGFKVPTIDETKCVDCGLCSKVCDFKKPKQTESNIKHAYSLVVKDKDVLHNSTSGGAFTVISDYVLSQGGYVVGAVMEGDFTIHHIITTESVVRDKMRGSKYVQSDITEVFALLKKELKNGTRVLFTGTPCQCAAIKSYFKDMYPNLIIADFLCHGVPSNKMFKEHVSYLEKHYGHKLTDFSFRDKKYGWNSYNNIIVTEDGQTLSKWINQIYYNFFVKSLSLRDGCFNCPYRSLHRPSDITIADFWGIEKLTGKKDHKGVSLLMTHTEIGEDLIQFAKSKAAIKEYPFEKIAYRINLHPAKPNKSADRFWKVYKEEGYNGIASRFFKNTLKNQIKFEIRKIAKRLKLN